MVGLAVPSGQELELSWHEGDSFKVSTFAQALSHISDPQSMLEAAIHDIVQAIPHADAGVICLYDSQAGQLKVKAAYDYGQVAFRVPLPAGRGAGPGFVFESAKAKLWRSAEECAGLVANLIPDGQEALSLARHGLRPSQSVICAPIAWGDGAWGSIHLEHCRDRQPFSMPDLAMLWALGNQFANCWANLLITQYRQRAEEAGEELLELLHQEQLEEIDQLSRLVQQFMGPGPFEETLQPKGYAAPKPILSRRELDVLRLVALSKSNKEIARELHISVKTVQTHRANILRKLDLHDRTDLVRYAVRTGLVIP